MVAAAKDPPPSRTGLGKGLWAQRPSALANMAADLRQIPDVDIDSDGIFKYVLIRVHLAEPSGDPARECKEIVRGYKWAEYHGEGGASARLGAGPEPSSCWGRGCEC